MRVWFTGDTHFGHRRILDLSRRPFTSLAEMEHRIVSNWASTVQPDDVVWHLGDLTVDSQWEHGLAVLAGLPGRKRLVTGNHDACWPGKRDFHRHQADYFTVFESVSAFARTRIGQMSVLLSHFPTPATTPAPTGMTSSGSATRVCRCCVGMCTPTGKPAAAGMAAAAARWSTWAWTSGTSPPVSDQQLADLLAG